jgi:hypothetical protein
LVGWIDQRLEQGNDQVTRDRDAEGRNALIEPLRNVYGFRTRCSPWRCPAF